MLIFMEGTIPAELGQLSSLQGMFLYSNSLEGTAIVICANSVSP